MTGDVKYASGTYRMFKLPKNAVMAKATVTYKGTIPDLPEEFVFDSSHSFKVMLNLYSVEKPAARPENNKSIISQRCNVS